MKPLSSPRFNDSMVQLHRRSSVRLGLMILLLGLAGAALAAEQAKILWQIGKPDGNDAEFALAPGNYRQFAADGLFVVGESDPKRDWPYVHPGPADSWAGARQHTFQILFGLKNTPAAGECHLQVDVIDAQNRGAPKLRVEVNGRAFEQNLANGAGEESINGEPAKGKQQKVSIAFPSETLRTGDNEIKLTTISGSWFIYDCVTLETSQPAELTSIQSRTVIQRVLPLAALQRPQSSQPILVTLRHAGRPAFGSVRLDGAVAARFQLTNGLQTIEVPAAAVTKEAHRQLVVEVGGKALPAQEVTLKPVRKITVYVLPHSHTDIGYTEIQTAIEKKQVNNLLLGMEAARKTASYPEGARFVWNVEVLWAADLYLGRLNEQQRADFLEAIQKGQVALNGMYLNELTGLCRPEELLRLFRFSTEISAALQNPTRLPSGRRVPRATDSPAPPAMQVPLIDSAMISDVPGYTWGTVAAMAQAGIKYFSTAPNYFDRIGDILVQWENKPFYWVSPSGKERLLVWIPFKGYAMSHLYHKMTPEFVNEYQAELDRTAYPYDISYTRWSGHGDNAVPDPAICEFIKDWNMRYAWPKFIISSTSTAFRAFEARYGKKLPEMRGDWTPYWEDGAGSSAEETAMNRASSDRLTQAETLWAMLDPAHYPGAAFDEAWRNVLLYSEHTWGADCSVSDPENQKTKEQWEIKRSYALKADALSRQLLEKVLQPGGAATGSGLEILNTTSWPRTELVTLSKEVSGKGDTVLDDHGTPVFAQRLASGELLFVAQDMPPFSSRRYEVTSGGSCALTSKPSMAKVDPPTLDNGLLRVRVDEKTGGIVELEAADHPGNLVDTSSGQSLNDYLFLAGDDLKDLQKNGPVKITIKDPGPLVATMLLESAAPGCNKLSRELRLVAGLKYLLVDDIVDKQRAAIPTHPGDWQFAQKGGKESVNFAFPFNVPNGRMALDIPLGLMRPEQDQIPGACKNWLTVGRWVDVANDDYGVTWATLDAPLVEVGGITATLLGSQKNPAVWRKKIEPTQKLYSWAMNNHWGTNYRSYQDGLVRFRFALWPHGKSTPEAATCFATALSQPLIVSRTGKKIAATPRLLLEPNNVTVLAMKPSDDGHALIVRLIGASSQDERTTLRWGDQKPAALWLSDTSERRVERLTGSVAVAARDVVTIRAELP